MVYQHSRVTKLSFYLISKNQIVILMLVMTLMGRMKTVPRMKVLRLQMLLRKKIHLPIWDTWIPVLLLYVVRLNINLFSPI